MPAEQPAGAGAPAPFNYVGQNSFARYKHRGCIPRAWCLLKYMQILSLLQRLPLWKQRIQQLKLKSILLIVSKNVKLLDPASNGIRERLPLRGGLDFACFL